MTDEDILGTTWHAFGKEGWQVLTQTTEIEVSTAAATTQTQRYFIDKVIREAMQFQIWCDMRRRENRCVPGRVFDDAILRQTRRLGKAMLRLRKAGCELWWSMSLDESTIQLFFVPMRSIKGSIGP
jgi:hypothetical protein